MNNKPILIISRYNEDVSWIKEYEDKYDYIIYNKGEALPNNHPELCLCGYNFINVENIGGNQRDIFQYIHDNYDHLLEIMIFIQAYPFDHRKKETFDTLIHNNKLTALEDYSHITDHSATLSGAQKLDIDGGYMEINNSWYIQAHNSSHNRSCRWSTFDEFMDEHFNNYIREDYNRFTPGSQYLITKDIAKHYPKEFWAYLRDILCKNYMTEAHIVERALLKILNCSLEPAEIFYQKQ